MLAFQKSCMSTCEGKSVNLLLVDFKSGLHSGMENMFLSRLPVQIRHCPRSHKTLKSRPCAKGPFVQQVQPVQTPCGHTRST